MNKNSMQYTVYYTVHQVSAKLVFFNIENWIKNAYANANVNNGCFLNGRTYPYRVLRDKAQSRFE